MDSAHRSSASAASVALSPSPAAAAPRGLHSAADRLVPDVLVATAQSKAWHPRLASRSAATAITTLRAVYHLRLCRPHDQVLGGWAHSCRTQVPARPAAAPRARHAHPPAPQSAPAPAGVSARALLSRAPKGVALAGHGRDEAAADHAYAAAASHSLLLHGVATLTRPHVGQRFTAVKGRRRHLVLQALLVGLALVVGAHCGRAVALAPARAAPVSVPVQARY